MNPANIYPKVTDADRKLARDLQRIVKTIGGPVLACDPKWAADLIAAHVARAVLRASTQRANSNTISFPRAA